MNPARRPVRRQPTAAPGERLADIIAALTSRMSDVQRHAFAAKMSELDRQHRTLTASTITLGSA